MKKVNYLILLVVVFMGISCEPTYVKEYSWAYPVAGDWTMNSYEKDIAGKDSLTSKSSFEFKTYNSSFGNDSIWLNDYASSVYDKATSKWVATHGNFWDIQCKVKVDMTNKTFANSKVVMNAMGGYEIGIKVLNGQIVGNDSIRFEIQFEDDAAPYGTTYILAGHRTTSYEEYMQ